MDYGIELNGRVFTPNQTPVSAAENEARNREAERQEIARLQTGPAKVVPYVGHAQPPAYSMRTRLQPCCLLTRKQNGLKCPICQTSRADIEARYLTHADITTWLGTAVATHVEVGPARRFACWGPFPSVRRAVRCRINGTRYHGWYYESSGNYCRLTRSK